MILRVDRNIVRGSRMLFLDEATSALDAENEAIVQQALEKLLYELNSTWAPGRCGKPIDKWLINGGSSGQSAG